MDIIDVPTVQILGMSPVPLPNAIEFYVAVHSAKLKSNSLDTRSSIQYRPIRLYAGYTFWQHMWLQGFEPPRSMWIRNSPVYCDLAVYCHVCLDLMPINNRHL